MNESLIEFKINRMKFLSVMILQGVYRESKKSRNIKITSHENEKCFLNQSPLRSKKGLNFFWNFKTNESKIKLHIKHFIKQVASIASFIKTFSVVTSRFWSVQKFMLGSSSSKYILKNSNLFNYFFITLQIKKTITLFVNKSCSACFYFTKFMNYFLYGTDFFKF